METGNENLQTHYLVLLGVKGIISKNNSVVQSSTSINQFYFLCHQNIILTKLKLLY